MKIHKSCNNLVADQKRPILNNPELIQAASTAAKYTISENRREGKSRREKTSPSVEWLAVGSLLIEAADRQYGRY